MSAVTSKMSREDLVDMVEEMASHMANAMESLIGAYSPEAKAVKKLLYTITLGMEKYAVKSGAKPNLTLLKALKDIEATEEKPTLSEGQLRAFAIEMATTMQGLNNKISNPPANEFEQGQKDVLHTAALIMNKYRANRSESLAEVL